MSQNRHAAEDRLAWGAATLSEPFRWRAVVGILQARLQPVNLEVALQPGGGFPDRVRPVEEIILLIYSTVARFWRAALVDPLPGNELINLLATTAATGEIDRQRRCNLLRPVLDRCPLNVETETAEAVTHWLALHPHAEELLHPTLLAYLDPAAASPTQWSAPTTGEPARRSGNEPDDEQETIPTPTAFVAEYIAQRAAADQNYSGRGAQAERDKRGLKGQPGFGNQALTDLVARERAKRGYPPNRGGKRSKG